MINNVSQISYKINEKEFVLSVSMNASLGEIWDSLFHFQQIILDQMKKGMPIPENKNKNENIEDIDGNQQCQSASCS